MGHTGKVQDVEHNDKPQCSRGIVGLSVKMNTTQLSTDRYSISS